MIIAKTLSKKIFLITIVGLMVVAFCMPLAVTVAQGEVIPKFLDGNKISCYASYPDPLPANEPCFVVHGHVWPNWKDVTPAQRQAFLSPDTTFELYIGETQVDLRKYQQFLKSYSSYEDVMLKLHYVQFPADYFTPGDTYVFHGIWYDNGNLEYEYSATVTFD